MGVDSCGPSPRPSLPSVADSVFGAEDETPDAFTDPNADINQLMDELRQVLIKLYPQGALFSLLPLLPRFISFLFFILMDFSFYILTFIIVIFGLVYLNFFFGFGFTLLSFYVLCFCVVLVAESTFERKTEFIQYF